MGLRKKRAYLKYLSGLLLFGSNGVIASFIDLSSYEIVLLRTLIGSALLSAIFFLRREKLSFYKNKRDMVFLAVSGAAMGTSWMALYEAYARLGVSIASLLYYCGPVIVMMLSPLVFSEKLTPFKVAGSAAVLAGVFLINGKGSVGQGDPHGFFCGLLSAVLYAFMVICNKKAESITGLENATVQLCVSFLTVAVFVGCKQGFDLHIPAGSVLPVLILGLVNTGIGCYFYFSSIGALPVQTVAICGYLEPLSAVVFSAVILRETMGPLQAAGAVLILGGAMLGECKNK